ncbi:unnamed protein product [Toxocara canis]|uniref:Shootin-1 n=1 Tax=Toxocara canis TaxID=6265 RepID=A0A183VBI6_TOXCA|nr:unnamed protein product [Toxocara canis]
MSSRLDDERRRLFSMNIRKVNTKNIKNIKNMNIRDVKNMNIRSVKNVNVKNIKNMKIKNMNLKNIRNMNIKNMNVKNTMFCCYHKVVDDMAMIRCVLFALNEELRFQNEQLQAEIQRMRQQFELSMRDKERIYQNRERNLAQYLSEEQKKMMDLWAELQQVRRQCVEYKEQTERDLENQRNEFIKVMRSVGGVARQLNIAAEHPIFSESGGSGSVQDVTLVEALTRFREQQGVVSGRGDAELNSELMKKYEQAIERIVQLESRGGDRSVNNVSTLEAELRRTKDRLNESLDALRKLNSVAKENRDHDAQKRSRSLSPGTLPIHELVVRLESAEDARKRMDKQLADSKKEINIQLKAVDDATREIRRLEDRLHTAESERTVAENARKHLEEEIRRLKLVFDQSAADGERKAIEEAEERHRLIEEEYKTRLAFNLSI